MAGTHAGGLKTAEKLKSRDPDFYRHIGAEGGRNGHTGGFAYDDRSFLAKLLRRPTPAQRAGKKGGTISRRRKHED